MTSSFTEALTRKAGSSLPKANRTPVWVAAVVGILALNAVALCVAHYLSFRSLWLDEAFVAVNVRFRSLAGLFSRLEYNQQFPRLYLSAIWLLAHAFGYELWSLRLLPCVFGVAGTLLWSRLLWQEFRSRTWIISAVAFLLLISNHFVFYYAGEFKQYSADFFFSGLAIWGARRRMAQSFEGPLGSWMLFSALWLAPMFLSLTYVFVAFAVAVVFFATTPAALFGRVVRRGAPFAAVAGIYFVASFRLDFQYTQDKGLSMYWTPWFIHGNSTREWLESAWTGISNILGRWWIAPATPLFTGLALWGGGIAFARRESHANRPSLAGVGAVLALMLATLALLKKYPLECGRSELFFFPFAVGMICTGLLWLMESHRGLLRRVGLALIVGVSALSLLWKVPTVTRQYYRGGHWENLNSSFKALEGKPSAVVIYGEGSKPQATAAPHLPFGMTFKYARGASLSSADWKDKRVLAGDFYYLYANDDGELSSLRDALKDSFAVQQVTDHLFLFKRG